MQPIHDEVAEGVSQLSDYDDSDCDNWHRIDSSPSESEESVSDQSEDEPHCPLENWAISNFFHWDHQESFLPQVIINILTNHGWDFQKLSERWQNYNGPAVAPVPQLRPCSPPPEYVELKCPQHRSHQLS